MTHTKGDGVFKIRGNKIYVHGTINGKFYRKSTGKKVSAATKAWIKRADPLTILAEILGVTATNSTKTSLEDIGLEALEIQASAKKISEAHKKDKLSAFQNKILPYFKDIPLEDISVKNIVDWINMLKENYSYTHVKFVKNLFKSIFEYAQNDLRLVSHNPFNSMTVKSIDLSWEATTEVYTTEEVSKLLNESTGWFRVFLDLTFKYGFRPAEIMVIKWSDINLKTGILQLQRSINNDNIIVEHKSGKGNKNHFRTIQLFESTLTLLKSYNEVKPHKEWLFINKDNKPFMQSQSIIDYHLKPLLQELGIQYKTLYAARRSYASIMKFSGENIEKIQEIMGHSEGSEVTEKHYISEEILTHEDRKKQAKKQEALFNVLIQSE
jgi:integrase